MTSQLISAKCCNAVYFIIVTSKLCNKYIATAKFKNKLHFTYFRRILSWSLLNQFRRD